MPPGRAVPPRLAPTGQSPCPQRRWAPGTAAGAEEGRGARWAQRGKPRVPCGCFWGKTQTGQEEELVEDSRAHVSQP